MEQALQICDVITGVNTAIFVRDHVYVEILEYGSA